MCVRLSALTTTPRINRPCRTTAAPIKLQPLQLALSLPGDIDDSPIDRRSLTEPGDSSCRNDGQRAPNGVSGRGGDTCRVEGLGYSQNTTGAITSPSADILTRDYRRTGSDTEGMVEPLEAAASTWPTSATDVKTATTMGDSFPASVAMAMDSASGAIAVEEEERAREARVSSARTAMTSQDAEVIEKETAVGGGAESDGTLPVETPANTSSMKGFAEEDFGDRWERRALNGRKGARKDNEEELYGEGGEKEGDFARSAISKGDEERGNAQEGAEAGYGGTGWCVTSTSTKATNNGVRSGTIMEKDYGDTVFPLALPGQAQEMHFGAAARAVVVASGSSRFMVSR